MGVPDSGTGVSQFGGIASTRSYLKYICSTQKWKFDILVQTLLDRPAKAGTPNPCKEGSYINMKFREHRQCNPLAYYPKGNLPALPVGTTHTSVVNQMMWLRSPHRKKNKSFCSLQMQSGRRGPFDSHTFVYPNPRFPVMTSRGLNATDISEQEKQAIIAHFERLANDSIFERLHVPEWYNSSGHPTLADSHNSPRRFFQTRSFDNRFFQDNITPNGVVPDSDGVGYYVLPMDPEEYQYKSHLFNGILSWRLVDKFTASIGGVVGFFPGTFGAGHSAVSVDYDRNDTFRTSAFSDFWNDHFHINDLVPTTPEECNNHLHHDKLVKLIEDTLCFIGTISQTNSKKGIMFAIASLLKARAGDRALFLTSQAIEDLGHFLGTKFLQFISAMEQLWKEIHGFVSTVSQSFEPSNPDLVLQSGDDKVLAFFAWLKKQLSNLDQVRNSEIVSKVRNLACYFMSTLFFTDGDLFKEEPRDFSNPSTWLYGLLDKIQKKRIQKENVPSVDLYSSLLHDLIFLCEEGYQIYRTGSITEVFYSKSTFTDFHDRIIKMRERFHTGGSTDLETCSIKRNFNSHALIKESTELIDYGRTLQHSASLLSKSEKLVLTRFIDEIKLLQTEELIRLDALAPRELPFSVLIAGGSGVGKSTLTNMLFTHFALQMGLDPNLSNVYTVNPVAKFWDNFSSHMWGVRLDDIAFMKASKQPQGDLTLDNLLNIVNTVPFMPDQASLDNKGRTPCRAKIVIATSNNETLGAYHHFNCPSAVQRRLPYIIIPQVKDEYKLPDGQLDSSKANVESGQYPDFWHYTVKKVEVCNWLEGQIGQTARTTIVLDKAGQKAFLTWYIDVIKQHVETLKKINQSDSNFKTIELCSTCCFPKSSCSCLCPYCHNRIPYCVCESNPHSDFPDIDFEMQFGQRELDDSLWSFLITSLSFIYQCVVFCGLFILFCWLKNKYDSFVNHTIVRVAIRYGRLRMYNISQRLISWLFGPRDFGDNVIYNVMHQHVDFEANVQHPVATREQLRQIARRTSDRLFSVFNREYWKNLGEKYYKSFKRPAIIIGLLGFAGVSYKLYRMSRSSRFTLESEEKTPEPRTVERQNPFYKESFDLCKFNLSKESKSLSGPDNFQVLVNLVINNIYHFEVCSSTNDKFKTCGKMLCIKSGFYLTNNHTFAEIEKNEGECVFMLDIFNSDRTKKGVSSNITKVTVTSKQMVRDSNSDLCLIYLSCLQARRDLTKYFQNDIYSGVNASGSLVFRDYYGTPRQWKVLGMNLNKRRYEPLDKSIDCWQGSLNHADAATPESTTGGDCGSVFVMRSSSGNAIVGIHAMGDSRGTVRSTSVTQSWLISAIQELSDTFNVIHINEGSPRLAAETAKTVLTGDLHKNSSVRYLESGTLDTFGTITVRNRPSSSVKVSPLKDYFSKHMGYSENYKVRYFKPETSSYKPWYIALTDMVNPVTSIREDILNSVTNSYIADILSELNDNELKHVHVYTDTVAINGVAGISYVDSINRQSSAGCPWNKSKSNFLVDIEATLDAPNAVHYVDEIMDRAREIEEIYKRGDRAMPLFCAHLKDEPVSFRKASTGETRVFTGAPCDWSHVVRKYLLSVIRLVQNNRFVFEAGPGTVAQSKEWGDIYRYLTSYSDVRPNIVAGDYKSFDKRMPSSVILCAFKVLRKICEVSGYSDEQLKVISGIAHDVAFPFVSFNGDLLQFYGCNPSGHPLTVILNSLVNSIYMRYAYTLLNPEKHCKDFRQNVRLMTYGDDNIMGVSLDRASWFNHTSISKALASIDILYTMPDKEADSVPFVYIQDGPEPVGDKCASFLKRGWSWNDDVNDYFCPLAHKSIEKSIMVWTKSSITDEDKSIDVLAGASREYFYYGREIFNAKRQLFANYLSEQHLWKENKSKFLTFDELVEAWKKASAAIELAKC